MLYPVLQNTLMFMTPLLIVAIAGLISEKSGVINIALEGIMVFGAFTGIYVLSLIRGTMPDQLAVVIALLVGGVTGLIFSALHAFAAINLKANQTISGTALNILAPVLAAFIIKTTITGKGQQIPFGESVRIPEIPILSQIPFIGDIFFKNVFLTSYIALIVAVLAWFVLQKTKLGLRIRACGENPQAADAVGINIYKIRYVGVLTSGFLAGMGGVVFVTCCASEYNATVSGYGFLALAVLIFGNWKPFRIIFAASFFGFMATIAASYSAIPFLNNLGLPKEIYSMLPYIATLILLMFTSKSSNNPKAAGEIYDKSKR